MAKTLFDKGILGAPSLVHTPGERQLKTGGKKRSKLGRAALFNKDDAASANSVHADTAIGNERKRKVKAALVDINKAIFAKDWAAFDAARAAAAPGRQPGKPKTDSLARTTAQALSAAAPHVAGGIGGEIAGATAGRLIGGALGGAGGPVGAAAGAFAGGIAGDYVGRKIADAVFGPSKSQNVGASLGSSLGGTAGYLAANALAPGGGAVATAVSRVLGTAAGDVAGTRFGGYVAQRVGGVLSSRTGDTAARYGTDAALDAGSDIATVGRFSAGAAKVAKGGSIVYPPVKMGAFPSQLAIDDIQPGTFDNGTAARTRFRTMLNDRETKQTALQVKRALFGPKRPENFQPRHEDTVPLQRQKLQAMLTAQNPTGPYPWSTANKRRTLFKDE